MAVPPASKARVPPPEWQELEVKEVVTGTIVPLLRATLAVSFGLATCPNAVLRLSICPLYDCDPQRCLLFRRVFKAAPLHTKVSPRTKFFVFDIHREKSEKRIWFAFGRRRAGPISYQSGAR